MQPVMRGREQNVEHPCGDKTLEGGCVGGGREEAASGWYRKPRSLQGLLKIILGEPGETLGNL